MNEVEKVPFDILDEFPETGDLSSQTGGDVIEAAKRVRFKIESIEPRVNKDKDTVEMLTAKLNIRVSIGPLGIDGNGRYKGKNLFLELLTWANPDRFNSDWWQKQARFPYKQFLQAVGYDHKNPPKVNESFLIELKGKEFIGDVVKVEIRQKDDEGKYVGTGEFKNDIRNLKSMEASLV